MNTFASDEDIEHWLEKQSRSAVVLVLAARAVLRAIPTLSLGLRPATDEGESFRDNILSVFRAATVSWAAAAFPTHATNLQVSAASASIIAVETSIESTDEISRAAAMAARVASDAYARTELSLTARYAAFAAVFAAKAA